MLRKGQSLWRSKRCFVEKDKDNVIHLPFKGGDEEQLLDLQLALVTWKDIIATSGWEDGKDVTCPLLSTIGWIFSEDSEELKIGNTVELTDTIGDVGQPYGITCLPVGCIVSVEYL